MCTARRGSETMLKLQCDQNFVPDLNLLTEINNLLKQVRAFSEADKTV